MGKEPTFEKEADLCRAFIECVPKEWVAYPETGGFDIVLVRKADGFQIGVEAKLRLNAKVISQAAEDGSYYNVASSGPDCRAVLIPAGVSMDLASVCGIIGVTIITMRFDRGIGNGWRQDPFRPSLPRADNDWDREWTERCPISRIELPEWVPDVIAGDSAPVALTLWKVKAIKIAVTLAKRGYVTRGDFKHHKIDMSRWTQGGWLTKDGKGGWSAGPRLPDFRAQHPINYAQIEGDYAKWEIAATATQRGLFAETVTHQHPQG